MYIDTKVASGASDELTNCIERLERLSRHFGGDTISICILTQRSLL